MQRILFCVFGTALLASFLALYWDVVVSLFQSWRMDTGYAYGMVIPMLSLVVLFARRHRFPESRVRGVWFGLVIITLAVSLRLAARVYSLDAAADAWSMIMWLAGATCLLGGTAVLWWSAPAILLLGFMIPIPYSLELPLGETLQTMTTHASVVGLRCLGQPAVAVGHSLLVGDQRYEIGSDQMVGWFLGILACGFACASFSYRSWFEKIAIMSCTVPLALVAGCVPILVTASLLELSHGEAAAWFRTEVSPWVVVPVAATFLLALTWYVSHLTKPVQVMNVSDLVLRHRD